jgi:hypothetical protein
VRVAWPRRLRNRVVCAEDFEGARVARCAGVCDDNVVDGRVFAPEAREADAEDHFRGAEDSGDGSLSGLGEGWRRREGAGEVLGFFGRGFAGT